LRAFEPALLIRWQMKECAIDDGPCNHHWMKSLGSQKRLAELAWERQIQITEDDMAQA
jgi:hypothetical protein